ncbi:unnamed protein product [Aphanomyces euteiches]|uniref:Alpha/beta hydrolase fold-3 domain-containing protein n=1 Tax=Aphanomyces euteiches TaxID=100861 RepID=A0A6G0X2V9_9STRA|nr:hypothetical protein Ae201684_009008 [Aphanomyces euteiches]KAH9073631.1 hypothetical protein Ae201684P_003135 [Aphanomyces euteiches]
MLRPLLDRDDANQAPCGKPPVDGWSIRTEIATKLLALVFSAEITSARKVNSNITYLGNLTLKTRLTPLKTDKFEAIWFGDALNDASDVNMLYIHGGGFVWCHAETNAQGVVGMVSNAKSQYGKTLVALGLDYKLAPEAKFPSQLHEALAAYEYLTTRSSKPILLLGDSAGGNLVLSLLLALKLPENKHLRRPAAAVAVSPWCQLDFSNVAPSYTKNQKSDYCGAGRLSHYVGGYVGSASVKDPLVNPICGDFRGCCPILIHYGGKEVFQDDIEALVGVLKEQQVDVTAVKNPLAPHDTPMMPVLFGDMALSGGQVIAAFLAKHA